MDGYHMPENHEAKLKNLLGLQESQSVPQEVEELYWRFVRASRKLSLAVHDPQLVNIVILANYDRPAVARTFAADVKEKKVTAGGKVFAKFRNEWKLGVYRRKKGNKFVVELDDGLCEEREFNEFDVRLPMAEELKALQA